MLFKNVKTMFQEEINGLNLGGIGIPKVNISCQLQHLEKNREISLFDLQIVSFWALKKAPRIAEIENFAIS